jgi:hypothetical protein
MNLKTMKVILQISHSPGFHQSHTAKIIFHSIWYTQKRIKVQGQEHWVQASMALAGLIMVDDPQHDIYFWRLEEWSEYLQAPIHDLSLPQAHQDFLSHFIRFSYFSILDIDRTQVTKWAVEALKGHTRAQCSCIYTSILIKSSLWYAAIWMSLSF